MPAENPTPGMDERSVEDGPKDGATLSAIEDGHRVELEALRESERRFRTVFEAAPLGIAIADRRGYFLEANDAFLRMLGYDRNEITQFTFVDITYPEDRPQTQRLSQKAITGKKGHYVVEKRYLKKDGGSIWVIVRATAVKDSAGKLKYWLGLMEDLSEHKRASQALQESAEELRASEEKYRRILEGIDEGYFEVDLKGNFTFFNNAVCKIFGYAPAELMTMNNRDYTSPQTAKRMFQVFNKVYRTGRPAKVLNYEIIPKEGGNKVLEVSAALIRDSGHNPIGFRGLIRDVTERLQTEKEKEQLAGQIQQAQKMEAIGTLAGGVAHDFNNLLMGFQGNLSMMLADMAPSHPHYDYLKNMETYVKRGSQLTRQIMGFARGGKYEVKPTNLNDLVEKSSEMFGRAKREIAIHRNFHRDLWTVAVDRGQIEQVLLNLFVNAWQAMPGGGDLFIETANMLFEEGDTRRPYTIKAGKYVMITVTDTGIGMDAATQARIFEPFFTTKEIGRGTGLGLASAYGIIKNHGGYISVSSEKGHGAAFKIFLPITDKEITEETPVKERTLVGRETILFVDDEKMVADIGREMLEKLGYCVLLAESGEDALTIFEEHHDRIDLVILDMIMPDMGGSETFDRLRTMAPDIKVLLSSGYSLDGQASHIMERGCNGFIQKPFNMKKISMKIREILDA